MKFLQQLKEARARRQQLSGIPVFGEIPKTVKTSPEFVRLKEEIDRKHAAYVSDISSPDMAMSLELAHFLLGYCLWKQPNHLLDLGSGFSSYVFRLYRDSVGDRVVVYSVDDHAAWLKKTEHYLENAGLNTEHLYLLTDLQGQQLDGYFDLVLLDLNYVEVRRDHVAYTSRLLSENGVAVVDDVHKTEFLKEVKRIAAEENKRVFNIKKSTFDAFGRFAILLTR